VLQPQAPAAPLALPADQPFAIHAKRSSQNPGADGQASGESDASPDGRAFCAASAAKGGAASAEFNLGHRVENRSTLVQEAAIECEFDLKQEVRASAEAGDKTLATANLVLVVLDAHHHAASRAQLVQADSDTAPGTATTRQHRTFTARFEPGATYDIMLFGKVDAGSAPSQEASARLDIGGLRMRLRISPAQTQPHP
jgi:hypothetical protein